MRVEQMLLGPMAVFSYIVGCEEKKECLVIDPAGSEGKILSKVQDLGMRVRYVVNTHGHADHTAGNRGILAKVDAQLVIHEKEAQQMRSGTNRFFSVAMGKRPTPGAQLLVQDGDSLVIGETILEVIHTPGHTPGSICLYGEGNLFTGDTLFVGAVGRTDLKGGSFQTLLSSLKKLLALPPDTWVWPGHHYGDRAVSTLAREKRTNPYIVEFLS
jgi:glyoxylase-like metal-dependent hydrolase (beta-lactamase superfamily II)